MKIKIHTYPDGPADNLDPYDEILRINAEGRFIVQQAGEGLVDGDRYALSPQQELPARKAEEVLDFIGDLSEEAEPGKPAFLRASGLYQLCARREALGG